MVVRGLASFALLWQFLWILSEPELWPNRQGSVVAAAAMTLASVAWLVTLVTHLVGSGRARLAARFVDVTALGLATVTVLWTASAGTLPDWGPATDLAALTAGVAGLLLELRASAAFLVVVTAVQSAAVLGIWPTNPVPPHDPENLLYTGFLLSTGTVAIAARHVLKRDAGRADAAAASAAQLERERRTEEDIAMAVRRQERVLHETVLNTLTAVVRGGLTTQEDLRRQIAVRCREAASVMRDLVRRSDRVLAASMRNRDLARDLAPTLGDLSAAGIHVEVDCPPLDAVPSAVYAAVRTAAREALSNVLRHSGAQSAWLTAHVLTGGVDGTEVTVEVRDDGRGFDPGSVPSRYGLAGAVAGSVAEVGGWTEVTSRPGSGTVVAVGWRASHEPTRVSPELPPAAGFAIPGVLVFGGYLLLTAALTMGQVERPGLNAVALALLLGTYAIVAMSSFRGPFGWRVVVLAAAVGLVVFEMQDASLGAADGQPWVAWASIGVAALFLVVVGGGPAWAWPVLLGAWLLMQGDVIGELVSPGTATLLAGALFGRSVRRNARAYERAHAAAVAESTALAVASEGVLRLHRRYGALRESYAVALLDGIADGTLDPDDPLIREQAALEERFIRTVIRVDPALDPVHALASSLAVHARRSGVHLDVALSDTDSAVRDDLMPSKPSLVRAVQCSIPGEVARLTARAEDEWLVIRLLAPIAWGSHGEMRRAAVPGLVLEPDDPTMMWEIRLPSVARP